VRRAQEISGSPDRPLPREKQPELKPMTGAQLAFRPSAPPASKSGTGSFSAFKPPQPAGKPTTGSFAAYKPATGQQPAFKPSAPAPQGKTGTNQFAAFKPPTASPPAEEEEPKFDREKLQAQIRAMSITDSALGRAAKGTPKPARAPVEDTFVKTKMKQAESKVVDFDLDEDLG
jgi:hypothetical protein